MIGTLTFSHDKSGPIHVMRVDWLATAGGTASGDSDIPLRGHLIKTVTIPSATNAPTVAYLVVYQDANGVQILPSTEDGQFALNARSTSDPEEVYHGLALANAQGRYPAVNDIVTVAIVGCGGAYEGTVKMYYAPTDR